MEFGHPTVGFRYDCVAGVREVFADDRIKRSLAIFAQTADPNVTGRQLSLVCQICVDGAANQFGHAAFLANGSRL